MIDFKKEYSGIINQLSDPELISDWQKFEELSKRKKFLEKILQVQESLESIEAQIQENKNIIASEQDPQFISLAQTELVQLEQKQNNLKKEINNLLENSSIDQDSIIMEIRAGVGGEEAALFALDLFNMYSRYAKTQNWKEKILDSNKTEKGGIKEIIFELSGDNVFSKMKQEGGVHRVQRVPETEKSGRVHTSTITIAIMPKPKKGELKIKSEDLKIDFYRSSGAGGQNVNKRETAVRITHLPTGIVVASQTERNQLKNKENALAVLEAKLLEKKEQESSSQLAKDRKSQVGQAKRVEKIRTYNFLQDRLTDHRIKKSWHNLEKIMQGNIDDIIDSLITS
ncbi:MAG: peptide chain release factor 1 [Candidatus Pacebacteria bacterium]|nr:peptide chain release factor 1 [Candidatus Paceibacterota bacterium]